MILGETTAQLLAAISPSRSLQPLHDELQLKEGVKDQLLGEAHEQSRHLLLGQHPSHP